MNKKDDEKVHMSIAPEKRDDVWFEGDKYIPIKDMTDVHLQRAKMFAQKKELFYFNMGNVFAGLIEKLDEEALSRGVTLKDKENVYFKNKKVLKDASNRES